MTTTTHDGSKEQQVYHIKRSSWLIVPLGLSYGVLYALFGFYLAAIWQTGLALLGLTGLFVLEALNRNESEFGHVLTSMTLASVINSSWFFGGTATPGLVWYAIALIPSILFLDYKSMFFWLVVSLCALTFFFVAEDLWHIPFTFPPEFLKTFKIFTTCGACLYIFLFILASRWTSEQALTLAQENEKEAIEANHVKSMFLAKMSHELRTPLNAIVGYAELVKEELEDFGEAPKEIVQDIHSIQRASQILGLHLSNILDLSKIERGMFTSQNEIILLNALTNELFLYAQTAREQHNITFTIQNQLPPDFTLVSDRKSVLCILLNLLDNAFKFTKEGEICLLATHEGEDLVLEVRDSGIGIAPEHLETIFDSFVQAEEGFTRSFDGVGIGLTLSRKLAAHLGGCLSVQSEVGQGSTFQLRIPHNSQDPT
ncbi:MAG TPA: hypothetical protein DCE42_12530 [Myxococcales bacterium]|mgnify:CR=1 FL=1|nr:hypothetical protein [Deltaproteobacteria bacterium]MBU50702.1 hypothetical protein [Deltaproteobacteria bacterium]HAA55579.1 hypothetical protein [Myxococcales bacterium]|tara:strand:- start:58358 stop:59641 length:1284 start_codon:yes stop_codon:yes gene_type:complete